MVLRTNYKDVPAILVESQTLQAWILPEDGGKIASIKRKKDGKELLAVKPGECYKRLAYDGSYVDSECSGFDDMFPTVDPDLPENCSYPRYPDHGECCRLPYEAVLAEETVALTAESRIFPITYTKTLQACEDGLCIGYRIKNHADVAFPFLWAGHMMLAGEENAQVLTPFGESAPTEMMFADPMPADPYALPKDRLMAHKPGEGVTYKFYYSEPMPEGRFGICYGNGSTLTVTVDETKLPWLGIWLNNGTFQNGYSITFEPCTVPYDAPSRAAKRGLTSSIPAGGEFSFHITLQLKEE